MRVYVCMHDTVTQEQIDFLEKEYGMTMTCSTCGKRLEPGDRKDHHWPFFDDFNTCKKCMKNESGGDLK